MSVSAPPALFNNVLTAVTAKAEEPKLSKKQQKKLKANDGKAIETSTETLEKKKVQFAKNLEQGPTNSQKDKKTPEKTPEKTPGKAAAAGPSKKVVQGITIEDKKAGSGPAARNGQKLGMRYIGKLDNGQIFDSNTKGKPFTFRLGKGEVIKGWDIGLAGMQVGGERRVIIPANLAYGKKGVPGIPGNSTLTFDGELLYLLHFKTQNCVLMDGQSNFWRLNRLTNTQCNTHCLFATQSSPYLHDLVVSV
jgi:FK506-binding nuclear protein